MSETCNALEIAKRKRAFAETVQTELTKQYLALPEKSRLTALDLAGALETLLTYGGSYGIEQVAKLAQNWLRQQQAQVHSTDLLRGAFK